MKCAVCKSEINDGATLCPICHSHQSSFLRAVFYFAGIAGFLSLLASALVFLLSKAGDVKKEIVWRDKLQIISFMSDGPQVYLNNGDGDLFLSHVFIKASNNSEKTVLINNVAEKSKFTNHRVSSFIPEPVTPVAPYERNIKVQKETNCVEWVYFSSDDPRLQQYTNFLKDQLVSVDAQATLHYYSLHDGQEKKINFPAKGILFRSISKECKGVINEMSKKHGSDKTSKLPTSGSTADRD